MRKTLLAALIGANVFAVLPALAQVDLGEAGRAGAGVTAGTSGAVIGAPAQLGIRAGRSLQRAERDARHVDRRAAERTDRTLGRHGHAHVQATVTGSASARPGDQPVNAHSDSRAGADVDAAATADRAGRTARGVGDRVSDSAHAAIDGTGRTAGSVGDAASRTARGTSVGADAKVRARADAHGH